MNTRNRITLLLAAIIVVALLVVGMTLTTSAANEGDLVTEYGVVPAANANDNFAIFHKAEGAEEYTFFASASNPFANGLDTAEVKALTGEIVVLQLKDYNFSSGSTYTGAFTLNADVVFDFGGKTFTATNNSGTGTIAFAPAARSEQNPVINWTFKNGTVVTGKYQFLLLGWGGSAVGSDFEINITYNNVTFDRADTGAIKETPLLQVNKSSFKGVANITYNDCTYDMTGDIGGVVSNTLILFNANGHGSGQNLSTNIYVNGGDMYFSDFTGSRVYLYNDIDTTTSTATVTFGKGTNGYTNLHLPATYEFTHAKQYLLNGGDAYMVFDHRTADGAVAKVVEAKDISLETEYGTLPAQYMDIQKYPFVILTKATGTDTWTLLANQVDALTANSDPWVDALITKWWLFNGDVVFLQRRNVDLTNRTSCSNCIRPNTNLVVDMAGYTIVGSEDSNGTFFFATKATTNYGGGNGNDHRYWTFKNGTIQTKSACFILFGHNTKITDNPTINLTFENVTFDRADGATKEQPFVQFNGVTDSPFTANVTYNDCTFDIRGELPASKLYLFTVCNNASSLLTANIVVNGGTILADDTDPLQLYLLGSKCLGSFAMNEGSNGELLQLVLPAGTVNQFIKGGDSTNDLVNISGHPYAYSYWKTSSDGVNDTYTLVPYWMTTSQAIPKTSVTLSTDLIYNIYLPTARVTAAKINGEVVNLKNAPQVTLDNGMTYWHITVNAGLLGAGDEIELVTTINAGGSSRVDATRKLSVVKYAKTVLASNLGETNNKLAKDLLAYVKAACVYAGDKAETVAAIEAIIGADYTVNPEVAEAVASTAGLKSASLLLGEKPAFVFFPELDENGDAKYDLNAYKFAIGDTTVTTEITEIDGKTAIVVYTYAYAMSETVTYTIEGTEISGAYNLAAYLQGVQGNTNTVALVEALYAYSLAAKTYKTENA